MKSEYLIIFHVSINLIILCYSTAKKSNYNDCNTLNCIKPKCKCSNDQIPENFEINKTPMMIALSFNGIITKQVIDLIYKNILNKKETFKNPNGCPIQATYFVSDFHKKNQTDYCYVQNLFENNNEIGVGIKDYSYYSMHKNVINLGNMIKEQRRIIYKNTKINRYFLRGFRMPMLLQSRTPYIKDLENYNFIYDSSFIIDELITNYWPHRLNYRPSYSVNNFESSNLWEVPMTSFDINGKKSCPSLIKDNFKITDKNYKKCISNTRLIQTDIEKLLMNSFRRNYKNKSPLIINIETQWLLTYKEKLTDALVNFINEITLNNRDIYFLTITKIIDWIENPKSLEMSGKEWLWGCESFYENNCEMSSGLENIIQNKNEHRIDKKDKDSGIDILKRSEAFFPSNVVPVIFTIFTIFAFIVVMYDKCSPVQIEISKKEHIDIPFNHSFH